MRDDELTALLRSPALSLDPPVDLVASVHQGARRVRRRRTAGVVALSAAALGCAALVGPGLLGEGERPPETVAAPLASRFPQATTSVERLERLNGGDVVTFFVGTRWCTASSRTLVNDGCRGYVGTGPVAPFALTVAPGDDTLSVDRDTVTAGVLGTGVSRVTVELTDGTVLEARTVQGEGFPRPVWWAAVPRGGTVQGYTAYDGAGQVREVLQVAGEQLEVRAS